MCVCSKCCSPVLKIKQLVLGLFQQKGTVRPAPQEPERAAEEGVEDSVAQNRCVIFSTSKSVQSKYELSGEPVTIFCQNLPAYLGGRHDVWEKARGQVGLKEESGKTLEQSEAFQC